LRTLLWLTIVCGVVVLAASVAAAVPSHFGPTGVVATPTAEVAGAGRYDVAVDYIQWDTPSGNVKSWPVRLLAGVSDNIEVGVGYTRWGFHTTPLKVVPVNVKAVLVPESETSPAIAFGLAYAKYSIWQLKTTTAYAVATKTIIPSDGENGDTKGTLRGSLGLMYNSYSHGATETATKPFVSVEYTTPSGATTLAAEYKLKEQIASVFGRDAISSYVVRHMVTPRMWAEVGLTNAWYTVSNLAVGHELFFGVGYRWSRPAHEQG
jgi:hypothetical protein